MRILGIELDLCTCNSIFDVHSRPHFGSTFYKTFTLAPMNASHIQENRLILPVDTLIQNSTRKTCHFLFLKKNIDIDPTYFFRTKTVLALAIRRSQAGKPEDARVDMIRLIVPFEWSVLIEQQSATFTSLPTLDWPPS